MQRPELSIVVPVFNEEPENLRLLLERLHLVLKPMLMFYEVLFVDDGSEQASKDALRNLADTHSYIKIVTLSRNFGEQAAICAGLDQSVGDVVINMDSDLQDPPELIPSMLQYWRAGYDIVYTRQADRGESLIRQIQAKIFYVLLDAVSYIRIPRDAGEFRLMSRRAVSALRCLPESQPFLRGLVPWIGFKSYILPFKRDARQLGSSAYTIGKLISLAGQGLMAFSIIPLILTPILYGLGTIALFVMLAGNTVLPHFAVTNTLVLEVILVLGFLQASCFAFLGMYLTQILTESKSRPTYILQDVYVATEPQSDSAAATALGEASRGAPRPT